jgi:basic amino acid/polyamine antiporter, APA family
VLGTLAIIAIYLLANLAYLSVLSVEEMRKAPLVAADVALRLIGPMGVTLVSLTVLLSTFGSGKRLAAHRPAHLLRHGRRRAVLPQVAKVHPTFQTPYVAIIMTAALGVGFVLLRSVRAAGRHLRDRELVFYILSIGAIFKLRRRPDWNPPVRTPLYPVVPALFCLAVLFLLGNAFMDPAQRVPTLGVFGVILLGCRCSTSRRAVADGARRMD